VFFAVLRTGDELKQAFAQRDLCVHIDPLILCIDFDTWKRHLICRSLSGRFIHGFFCICER